MSGTRLLSRKAPATERDVATSLLIVAHGECGGLRENRFPGRLAGAIRARCDFASVETGFVRGAPSFEAAAANLPAGPVAVYPLFMSDGYYVRNAIPERLGVDGNGRDSLGRKITVLRPTGLDPRLPEIVARLADQAAADAKFDVDETTLLLVAHGSQKDPASRNATSAVAGRLSEMNRFPKVETAYLEEMPFLDDRLKTVSGPAVAVGLFIGEGMHGNEDLPQAVSLCGREDIVIAPALARSPEMIEAICDELGS